MKRDDDMADRPAGGRGPLADHLSDPLPPVSLEGRVLATLAQRGLLERRTTSLSCRRGLRAVGLAAAVVIAFALGRLTASDAPAVATPASRYALLLYESSEASPAMTQSEIQAIVAEYANWARDLAARGYEVSGEKLGDAVTTLGRSYAPGVPASAPRRSRTLGGFFIITAADSAEAVAIARTCPHLRYGGEIEVRPVDST